MNIYTKPIQENSDTGALSENPDATSDMNSTRNKSSTLRFSILILINVALTIGLLASSSNLAAGLWSIALMIALMFLGISVGLSLSIASGLGLLKVSGLSSLINVIATAPYSATSSWSLSVLPMFILMGMLLTHAGIIKRVYDAANLWFGWLPGGLAIGTSAAGSALASVSGSTIGMTYALGRAGIPEMLKSGYDRRVAVGAILTGGLGGALIPPSILLVIYAGIASVPIGPQLIAGIIPGLAIGLVFAIFFLLLGIIAPKLFGKKEKSATKSSDSTSLKEKLESLAGLWGLPVIMIVLFGGLFSGYFTPTEAGAAAAFVSLLLAVFYTRGQNPFKSLKGALTGTARTTAAIFLILIGAEMLTRMLSVTGLAKFVTDAILLLDLPRFLFLVALIFLYLVMGMFFDTMSMMLLTIPLLMPTFVAYDIDLLWFGVFIVLLGEIGMITPPVGVMAYIVYNISKRHDVNQGIRITLNDVFVSIVWFMPIAVLFLVLLILWPELATWLPELSNA